MYDPDGQGRRHCPCRRPRYRENFINSIPLKLRRASVPNLKNLEARADLHPDPGIAKRIFEAQKILIKKIKSAPGRNLFLSGDNGCGKTGIADAVLLDALEAGGRTVVACALSELLEDYRRYVTAPRETIALNIPRIQAESLKQTKKKYTILLDEADKPTVSEFRGEMLFSLLNEASNYGHQIVSTSNKDIESFVYHWSKFDSTHGNSIARRLTENAVGFEVFWTE